VAVGVLVLVGIRKMTVAVAVGVSVGVKLGVSVNVHVAVGDGSTLAVCVCAAPAVATTMVCINPGSEVGLGAAGAGRPGNTHASRRENTASKKTNFFMVCIFMIATKTLSGFDNKLHRTEHCFPNHERPSHAVFFGIFWEFHCQ
jgi:hypothetical protein